MDLNLSSSLLVSTLLKHIPTKQYEFSNKISFKIKKEGPLFPRDTSNYFSSFYALGNLNSVPNLPQYQCRRQYRSNHRSPIPFPPKSLLFFPLLFGVLFEGFLYRL